VRPSKGPKFIPPKPKRLCVLCRKRTVYGKTQAACAHCTLERDMDALRIGFTTEYRFCPTRKWRADYYIVNLLLDGSMVLIEIEGSVYAQGRHTRGKGYENDCRKYNQAMALGYLPFRFSTNQVLRGEAREFLKRHLKREEA